MDTVTFVYNSCKFHVRISSTVSKKVGVVFLLAAFWTMMMKTTYITWYGCSYKDDDCVYWKQGNTSISSDEEILCQQARPNAIRPFYQVNSLQLTDHEYSENRMTLVKLCDTHDDVIKWKHLPRYWRFLRGIHWSPVNSPHKGQWRGALVFSLICVWINGWVNNREAGELRRYCTHYDVTVMIYIFYRCVYRHPTTQRCLAISRGGIIYLQS